MHGSVPSVHAIFGLRLLLLPFLTPTDRGFVVGFYGFPLHVKTNNSKFQFDLERKVTRGLRALWCSVDKQITFAFTYLIHH